MTYHLPEEKIALQFRTGWFFAGFPDFTQKEGNKCDEFLLFHAKTERRSNPRLERCAKAKAFSIDCDDFKFLLALM